MDIQAPPPNPQHSIQRPTPMTRRALVVRITVGAAGCAILVGAAVFFWPNVRPLLLGSAEQGTAPESAVVSPDPGEMRDQERYRHVNEIRLALGSYVNAAKEYPVELGQLVPLYLQDIPLDPTTATAYTYVRNDTGYELKFSLEHGIFAISAGDHFLTPRGIDIRNETKFEAQPEKPTVVNTVTPDTEPASPLPADDASPSPDADSDGDGLTDLSEMALGTDTANHDTDGDGLSDSQEVKTFGTDPAKADTDGDGLTDGQETGTYGSDPKKTDTDNDGYADGAEVAGGFDPLGPGKLK